MNTDSTGSGGDQGWFVCQNTVFQTQPDGMIQAIPNPVVTTAGTLCVRPCVSVAKKFHVLR